MSVSCSRGRSAALIPEPRRSAATAVATTFCLHTALLPPILHVAARSTWAPTAAHQVCRWRRRDRRAVFVIGHTRGTSVGISSKHAFHSAARAAGIAELDDPDSVSIWQYVLDAMPA